MDAAGECDRAMPDSLMQYAPTIVLLLDAEGCISRVNSHFERITGYQWQEIIGRDWFATFLPEADRLAIRGLFFEVLGRGEISGHVNPIVAKDGRTLEIEWFSQVLHDDQGRFQGLLNIGHDVTTRIAQQQALEAARLEAERASQAKSRFLATASHDLRQPLQALNLLNSSLRNLVSDPALKRIVGMQTNALDAMNSLLNGLLNISKLEAGLVKVEIVEFGLDEVLERLRAEFEIQAQHKGLSFTLEASGLSARSDPQLLLQLLQNVVANAIRYTIRGGVTIDAESRPEGRVCIRVTDTGIGIARDQHELIFDEFYRVRRDGGDQGLGLGLSIVRRIADLLELDVSLQSDSGLGTELSFVVPAGRSPLRRTRGADTQAETGTPQCHAVVLLVDDDAAVLDASQMFLEVAGCRVIAASTAAEASALVDAEVSQVDVIVTDFHVGSGVNGLDIISDLRQRLDRAVPAVLVTGDTSPAVERVDIDGVRVLSKPVDSSVLLSLVEQLAGARDCAADRSYPIGRR